MGPNNNLAYLLHHLSQVIDKQIDQVLKEQLGIGLSQYKILMVLEWSPRIQQNLIAKNLGQTEASISRQVKLLINKGMLATKTDPRNRRRHTSIVTPFGMQVNETAASLIKNYFSKDLSITDAQRSKLTAELQQLHKQVCRPGRTGACIHNLSIDKL
ncbi:MAG TPA: helix-turn-helix domain-containing protein [Candidatus Sulfotelmatobacter sp.]|nr:helix-turn-helix domain-containing protein [Candidatus Sulfotelmatobacter sp.]